MEIHFWFFARVPVLYNQKMLFKLHIWFFVDGSAFFHSSFIPRIIPKLTLYKGKQIIGIYFMIIYINLMKSSLLHFFLIHTYLLKSRVYRRVLKSLIKVPKSMQ